MESIGGASSTVQAGAVVAVLTFAYLAVASVRLARADLRRHVLPNAIVVPAFLVGAVGLSASAVLAGAPARLAVAGAGAVGMFVLYLVLAGPGGMGFGDVKLAGVLGLFLGYLGWTPLVVGAVAAFVLGGGYAMLLLGARRATGDSGIPFGPWMLAGAWLAIVAAPVLRVPILDSG
ncbi:A24 family peptidase [Leifsonia sp. NPDC080035]|uniref:A24 family peptidase n=1 Tax=Leifsonia sp. NPDC080035 TaxID=3143936 RepID=A0AAU7G8X9_9MICO